MSFTAHEDGTEDDDLEALEDPYGGVREEEPGCYVSSDTPAEEGQEEVVPDFSSPTCGSEDNGIAAVNDKSLGCVGYLFVCSNATLKEIAQLGLFGAPDSELSMMKRTITSGTALFLFNLQTWKLMGTFMAEGAPEKAIIEGVFGGKFNSHVRVAPLESSIFEVQLKLRPSSGPKSSAEVEAFKKQLQKGDPMTMEWPGRKRHRKDASMRCHWNAAGSTNGSGAVVPKSRSPRTGYVFTCSNATQKDIESLGVFGAPERELQQMKDHIHPGTHLYLFNLQSWMLIGTFTAVGAPETSIAEGAFGGKFSAHVRVAPMDVALLQVQLQQRPRGGPKTEEEVHTLESQLRSGKAMRTVWNKSESVSEPVPKKSRKDCEGYVFLCNDATQKEIETLKIFGSPDWELPVMQQVIKAGTPLFLLNTHSKKLMGKFVALGSPEKSIVKGAFDGRFNSHVRVCLEGPLLEADLQEKVVSGPKSSAEVEFFKSRLKQVSGTSQEAWSSDAHARDSMDMISTTEISPRHSSFKFWIRDQTFRKLPAQARTDLQGDLHKLEIESGISIDVSCSSSVDNDSLTVSGQLEDLSSVKSVLRDILDFYGVTLDE